MLINQSGASMVELLIYVSLLSIFAFLVFSFGWQIHHKNKKILVLHSNLHVIQTAVDLLSKDLRASTKISSTTYKISCQNQLGTIIWQLHPTGALWRSEHNMKKKAVPAKVLDALSQFRAKSIQLKDGASMVKLKLVDQQQQVFKKKLLLRESLAL